MTLTILPPRLHAAPIAVAGLDFQGRLIDANQALLESSGARRRNVRDEFLATLSHELRTPLTAVQRWAQILQTRHSDPDAHVQLPVPG